ncbi:hypothetical protein HED51_19440 [Ochrobactrum grignonense]|nr:hypothetical protein [Brucella grignonensis]NKB84406.1 hypothetical protein [Brucella grignonensis]
MAVERKDVGVILIRPFEGFEVIFRVWRFGVVVFLDYRSECATADFDLISGMRTVEIVGRLNLWKRTIIEFDFIGFRDEDRFVVGRVAALILAGI